MKNIKSFLEYNYENIFKKLDYFMKDFNISITANRWIYDDDDEPNFSIYIRRAYHTFDGKLHKFLDLASISISENLQGKGIFTEFLKLLLKKYPEVNIYIESIQNPAIRHICKKFGFIEIGEYDMALIKKHI